MMTQKHLITRMVAAGAIGNAIEFYDFVVFGYLVIHIGAAFFPATDPAAAIIGSLGAFAAGMVMRPIGGLLLGGMADRVSRHHALLLSVVMIATPTFVIGLLPSYAAIGIVAPGLLIALRLIQGLSAGGEYPASLAWLIENTPPGRRAFVGSFGNQGACVGLLLGTGVCYAVSTAFGPDAMASWGWRVPFLGSALLALIAVLLRRTMRQVATAERLEQPLVRSPARTVLRESPRVLGSLFLTNIASGVTSFVVLMFVVPWLMQTAHMPYPQALELNIETLAALLVLLPLAGLLADLVGYRRTALLGLTILICGAWGCLRLMQSGQPILDQVGEGVLALGFALTIVPMGPLMVDALPRHTRVTGIALSYGAAVGIFGGLAPMVVQWLMRASGDEMAPAQVVMAAGAVSALALLYGQCFRKAAVGDPGASVTGVSQAAE